MKGGEFEPSPYGLLNRCIRVLALMRPVRIPWVSKPAVRVLKTQRQIL